MNHKRLSVSLVIPAYNEECYIGACLDSLTRQTKQPDEVIVIDNSSSDKTAEIAKKYPFVKLVKEPKQGRVFARNAGFDAAKGDVIARIDADTEVPPNWLEHIMDFYANAENRLMAFTGDAAFNNVRFPRAVAWLYHEMAFDLNRIFAGHPTLWGSNMAITKQQWLAVRKRICPRNDIHEDLDLSIHLHARGFKIYYDRHCRVKANLRRVYSNRHELWGYLLWWPRTLRVHHKKTWVICWFFGVLILYILTIVLVLAERIARLIGRKPLISQA